MNKHEKNKSITAKKIIRGYNEICDGKVCQTLKIKIDEINEKNKKNLEKLLSEKTKQQADFDFILNFIIELEAEVLKTANK